MDEFILTNVGSILAKYWFILHLRMCPLRLYIYYLSKVFLVTKLLYIRKLLSFHFLNLILQSIIFQKLNYFAYLWICPQHPCPKECIPQLCHMTPQYNSWLIFPSTLVLQLHGVFYMLLSRVNEASDFEPACLLWKTHAFKHWDSLKLITVFLCHISKLIYRNAFWLSNPEVYNV